MTIWRKSSFCGSGGTDDCVELAALGNAIGVWDSKAIDAGHLVLAPQVFAALLDRLKRDDQDS
ncbi:DUF397 domain-containing protein [Actinomadura luteofluorescens]|uniref:DUF397 domain-containing protein n=1 Tax=Actinomadura luteofluorescens TaxID=46163 RepID=UPI003D8C9799